MAQRAEPSSPQISKQRNPKCQSLICWNGSTRWGTRTPVPRTALHRMIFYLVAFAGADVPLRFLASVFRRWRVETVQTAPGQKRLWHQERSRVKLWSLLLGPLMHCWQHLELLRWTCYANVPEGAAIVFRSTVLTDVRHLSSCSLACHALPAARASEQKSRDNPGSMQIW